MSGDRKGFRIGSLSLSLSLCAKSSLLSGAAAGLF